MNLRPAVAAATILSAAFLAGTAGASVITFDFDDAGNGDSSYSKDDFTFEPTNFNSSTRCFTDNVVGPGNGNCFLEVNNGTPTSLTDDNDSAFDLLSFYINFQGNNPNSVALFGYDAADTQVAQTTVALGSSYNGSGDFSVYLASTGAQFTGALDQQVGYFVLINRDLFDGIYRFSWDATDNKQNRIDCVSVSRDGSNIAAADLRNCGPSEPSVVPLPAAGWLLLAGVGGLAAMRRRKMAA